MNWLEEAEFEEVEEIRQEDSERFKIKDLDSLNWALRKLAALNKKHQEEEQLAVMETRRITDWFTKQDESYQAGKNFFEGLITEYANEQKTADPKWKGQASPYGKVGYRKRQPKWDYGDEEKLVEYLDSVGLDTCVKVEKKPIKDEIKKLFPVVEGKAIFAVTGEVVPQITIKEQEPSLSIKLEG